jgi:hypothetical protein
MRTIHDITELEPGDLVTFIGKGGRPRQIIDAKTILDVGGVYELTNIEISNWSTSVNLKGIEGNFNSVMFELIAAVGINI